MITTPAELLEIDLKTKGRVGLTSGCFDLLHFYHLHYLMRCKAQCDFLIVGVDSDDLLTQFKNKSPNVPEYHRAIMVEALKCVNAVFLMRSLDDFRDVTTVADIVFKNEPTLYGEPIVGAQGKLIVIPDVIEVTSTTALVHKIRSTPEVEFTPTPRAKKQAQQWQRGPSKAKLPKEFNIAAKFNATETKELRQLMLEMKDFDVLHFTPDLYERTRALVKFNNADEDAFAGQYYTMRNLDDHLAVMRIPPSIHKKGKSGTSVVWKRYINILTDGQIPE